MANRITGHVSPVKAAELLGVSKESIYSWVRKGQIKSAQLCEGGALHILVSELERITGTKMIIESEEK